MRLFVSYAHVDRYLVQHLIEILSSAGLDPWFDHHLMAGQEWKQQLSEAIRQCEVFVYVVTPESVNSDSCRWEFSEAVKHQKRVVPVLLQAKTLLPGDLKKLQYVDFTSGPTPEAVAKLLGSIWSSGNNVIHSEDRELNDHLHAYTSGSLDVMDILPSPFEWVEVPQGEVVIADVSSSRIVRGGSKGGEFIVPKYLMAKYLITNSQFECFVQALDGYRDGRWWRTSDISFRWHKQNPDPMPSKFIEVDYPKTNISWFEAAAFCLWLRYKTEQNVHLPTEKQWQRAVLGSQNQIYPWGNEFDPLRCNVHESRIGKPTPVISFPNGVSEFGAMDMIGNVWEWCSTEWGTDNDNSESGTTLRVLRGGSFTTATSYITKRHAHVPHERRENIGFRLICEITS